MARFLFTSAAVDGHVNPMLSIISRMIERGHEIGFITGQTYQQKIEATGAIFYPFPKEIDTSLRRIQDLDQKYKQQRGFNQTRHMLHLLLDACEAEREVIESVQKEFLGKVLVSDVVIFATYFISEMSGLPCAGISFVPLALPSRDTAPFGLGILPGKNALTRLRNRLINFMGYHILLRDVIKHANKIRKEWGLGPLNIPFERSMFKLPNNVICLTSSRFEYPRSDLPENVHFVGPVFPIFSFFKPPNWWDDLNHSCPIILVNQGTVANDLYDLIAPTIDGFKDQSALIIAVPLEVDQLGELPDNVRAEPFIPFDQLLPHVDVMVTNGGHGGTQIAIAHGIPLIVAGETEDKMEVAARVEWAGAGINLRKQRPTSIEIRQAVNEVLTNPCYREKAKSLQVDFAKYDALTRTCELLESLI